MSLAKGLGHFYRTERGEVLNREIARCLKVNWGAKALEGHHLLCVGYPPPCLKSFLKKTSSAALFLPSFMEAKKYRRGKKNSSTLGDESHMPFRPGSYEGSVIFHALEYMEDPKSFMEELWRVLSPGGRLFVMVPNRMGAWKKSGVPFGYGLNPFKHKNLRMLLEANGFTPTETYGVLYGVPVGFIRKILFSGILKTLSGGTVAGFPGFLIFEAVKETGPAKIKFKEPLRVVPGVRVNPEPSPE